MEDKAFQLNIAGQIVIVETSTMVAFVDWLERCLQRITAWMK